MFNESKGLGGRVDKSKPLDGGLKRLKEYAAISESRAARGRKCML